MQSYRTLKESGETTLIIKKSKFIGYARPVEREEDALAFIEQIRRRHWDATHNCYAYQIGLHDEVQKSNDDGEPAGTAGKPILEVIKKERLKNTVVVVTRYFGGILLGAGGLIRAYGQAASHALHAAGIVRRVLCRRAQIDLAYPSLGKVEYELRHHGFTVTETAYDDRVHLTLWVPQEEAERLQDLLAEATGGQAAVTWGETEFRLMPED